MENELRPLEGGFSGETFLAEVAGERTVVRVYAGRGAARGPRAPEVDAALLHLVRGLVPVPEVLDVRRGDPEAGLPGLLVTSFVAGERLDLLLPVLDTERRAAVGRQCGELLARLAGIPMPRGGLFADPDLRVTPMPAAYTDLVDFAEATAARLGWSAPEVAGLVALARADQDRLDRLSRACLVHGDLNPKNLLVDPKSLQVTALLDWEFAHAGSPVGDLGNLLRHDRGAGFAEDVVAAYVDLVPDAPSDLDELMADARAADLWALLDLAPRRAQVAPAEAAYRVLLARVRGLDAPA